MSLSMIETSMPRASSGWLATWPKRPKPMISTLPLQASARLDAVHRLLRLRQQPAQRDHDQSGVSTIEMITVAVRIALSSRRR